MGQWKRSEATNRRRSRAGRRDTTPLMRQRDRSGYFDDRGCGSGRDNKTTGRRGIAYRSAIIATIIGCVVSVTLRTMFHVNNVAMTDDAESPYDDTMDVVLELLNILCKSLNVVPKE